MITDPPFTVDMCIGFVNELDCS